MRNNAMTLLRLCDVAKESEDIKEDIIPELIGDMFDYREWLCDCVETLYNQSYPHAFK